MTSATARSTLATALARGRSPLSVAHSRLGPSAATAGQALLVAPFDVMRHHYASVVIAGLMPRSLLASGRLEKLLDSLESLILGPLARRR